MLFITGAGGFIGRYVVKKALLSGQEVCVLTRNTEKYLPLGSEIVIEGSILDWNSWCCHLNQYKIETCVHLAWEDIPDYSYNCSERNLLNSLAVLRICEKLKIKNLIITGSCWEYKNPRGPIVTHSEMDYSNPFKASKQSIHMMASTFCAENNIYLNWLRVFYAYGPGQREQSLIPYVIKCFKEGIRPKLSGLVNANDFVFVEDVADAIVKVALEHSYPHILNVGSGKAIKVIEIVQKIGKLMNANFDIICDSDLEGVCFWANADEMYRDYGWRATTSMDDGIIQVMKEYQ